MRYVWRTRNESRLYNELEDEQSLSFDQKSLDENSLSVQIVWLRTQQIYKSSYDRDVWFASNFNVQRTFAWNKIQTQNDVEIDCWEYRFIFCLANSFAR